MQIAPYKCGKKTGCDYCSYASVCGFDKKNGSTYRMLKPMKDDDVFLQLDLLKKDASSTEEQTNLQEGEENNGRS